MKFLEDEHFFLNQLQHHNEELLLLQTKIIQRASKPALWLPAIAVFKMKENILQMIDVPISEKEANVPIEAEVRDTMP